MRRTTAKSSTPEACTSCAHTTLVRRLTTYPVTER